MKLCPQVIRMTSNVLVISGFSSGKYTYFFTQRGVILKGISQNLLKHDYYNNISQMKCIKQH